MWPAPSKVWKNYFSLRPAPPTAYVRPKVWIYCIHTTPLWTIIHFSSRFFSVSLSFCWMCHFTTIAHNESNSFHLNTAQFFCWWLAHLYSAYLTSLLFHYAECVSRCISFSMDSTDWFVWATDVRFLSKYANCNSFSFFVAFLRLLLLHQLYHVRNVSMWKGTYLEKQSE